MIIIIILGITITHSIHWTISSSTALGGETFLVGCAVSSVGNGVITGGVGDGGVGGGTGTTGGNNTSSIT